MAQSEKDIQAEGIPASPAEIVSTALRTGCRSIAYTYTEPTIFFEYAYDTARLAHRHGLANIFVSNGYQTAETLEMLRPYIDAINIDLKAFSNQFYRNMIGARLQPVLDTLKRLKQMNIWVEVTTLVIPNLNDHDDELRAIAHFIATELGPDTPWHVSRFYPTYKLASHPPTPVQTVQRAREIGMAEGLRYVYEGNVPGGDGEHTYCPTCHTLLIGRYGFHIYSNQIQEGACPQCNTPIVGIGMSSAVMV
jgi:pyruvate formate lyase activating enzyme